MGPSSTQSRDIQGFGKGFWGRTRKLATSRNGGTRQGAWRKHNCPAQLPSANRNQPTSKKWEVLAIRLETHLR